MKLLRFFCLISVGLLMAQNPDPAATARKALDMMLGGKYQELHNLFAPASQKDMTVEALTRIGNQLKALGPAQIGEPTVTKPGANFVVTIPAHFATQNINFTIAVTPTGEVFAMLQRPGDVAWQRPAYSKPDTFHEQPVTVGDGDWKLPGTLTLPNGAGPFPAVVLVHGSGKNDRDETVGASKMFKDLAEGLASRGIAVLRYDKRTRVYAAKTDMMGHFTVEEEVVQDAVKAAALLRAQKEVNPQKVFLLGHDLGGYLSPRIAEEDEKFAGIIVMGGNVRPLEDLIVEQATTVGVAAKDLDLLKAQAKRVTAMDPGDSDVPQILGMKASYLLDLRGYDPTTPAKSLNVRMLILQGERDFQVNMSEFALWKSGLAGKKDATLKSYPALNHVFVAGEGKSTEAEYRKPGHVAPEVIDDIAKWILQ